MKRYTFDGEESERPKKYKALSLEEEREEERLTSLLFSGGAPLLGQPVEENSFLPTRTIESDDEHNESDKDDQEPMAAWHDEDDDQEEINLLQSDNTMVLRKNPDEELVSGNTYEERLRNKFESLQETPDWAQVPDDTEPEEDILKTTHSLISSKTSKLPKGTLGITRMNDANIKDQTSRRPTQVKFHPSAPLLLAAGGRTMKLFQIDGKENTKLQGIRLEDLDITSAFFTRRGEEVICTGPRPYFYSFDLTTGDISKSTGIRGCDERSFANTIGNDEYIAVLVNDTAILLSAKTKHWIANLKMNGKIRSGAFSADSSTLSTCGTDGEVYVWDLKERRCIHRYRDDGAVQCTAMGHSRDDKYTAVGSSSGIVNIYNTADVLSSNAPKPQKIIDNLTTSVSYTKFNHDSQLLGIASNEIDRQFRLVHIPSYTVFSNFPKGGDPLRTVAEFDFSPNSGFVAFGNSAGRVLLYRLNYYPTA